MHKAINLTGRRFSRLVVVERAGQDKFKRWCWHCVCDCGNKVIVSQNNLRTKNTKSCGCLNIEWKQKFAKVTKRPSGPDHYRWIPDRTSVVQWRSVRTWRQQVLTANHNCCMKCGSKLKLHVHHADSWNENEGRRTDPFNGVPLCAKHHRRFHTLYGRSNTTQEQLHEFLGLPSIDREIIQQPIERPTTPHLARIFDLVISGNLTEARRCLNREINILEKDSS